METLHAMVRAHPLGALVRSGASGLHADHIPFLVDPAPAPFGTLRCHVARGNAAWRELASAPDVLVIFQGEQAYVTPSWYAGKALDGKVVPTWNYVVVHAYGKAAVIHDAEWLHRLVTELTQAHEAPRDQPWAVSDAPVDFVRQQLRAIVGIEIPLTRLIGKWKASQNRGSADVARVADGLQAEGNPFAAVMRER